MAADVPDDWRAERAALINRLASMPEAMRALPQWLLYKLEQKPGQPKPAKVPYYASGRRRVGKQGDAADRHALVSFEAALKRLGQARQFAGLGFAFLPGDGLVGIDIDGAIDLETGEISAMCRELIDACASYTERSPSGKGVHIITAGHTKTFKSNDVGLEVFCGAQFFTCTGAWWPGALREVRPLADAVLARMRELVEQGKAHARAVSAPSLPAPGGGTHSDLVSWLEQALQVLDPACGYHEWIGIGMALKSALGDAGFGLWDYWSSKAGERYGGAHKLGTHWKSFPGTDVDGALTIFKMARKGGRWKPPREYLAVHGSDAERARIAKAERPALRLVSAPDATPEPSGSDPRPEPSSALPQKSAGAASRGAGGGTPPADGKPFPTEAFKHLRENFALIYGTDTVWDGENRLIMKIANMAHAHGSDLVKLWKGGQRSPRRGDGKRWTVMPANVVFDPSESCDAETHINLYGGFPTKPKPGDVEPILELIRFLCSRASSNPDECEEIMHWFMCWWAYPLQHKGAKLRTAVVMHGDEGAGKNFLTDTVVMMYGEYGATVGQDELEDKFNDWRSRKLMVVGDEVSSRAELVHNKNRLKALITSTTVQINPKNLPRREEANHINVVFNSNELQPLALDNSDRRYLVLYTPRAREFSFYERLGRWRDAGGVQAFYHYLLHYELTGFDPFAPAPVTEAKRDLIDLNRKSPERFWLEWSAGELELPYRSCTLPQAYQAYLKYAQRAGDRYPLQRNLFTRMLLRISDTMGRPCSEKVMKVDYGLRGPPNERTTRMLLVTPVPDGVALGEFATEAWRTFDPELKRFLGVRFGAADGDSEGEPM